MKPIIPFEPIFSEQIPQGASWVAQVKWDGVRVLTYFDGSKVRLFNRKLNERTLQYPELLDIRHYCSASSVILDGEVIALEQGKPSFYEVMRRDGVRKVENVERARKSTPITYMIFDIVYLNGQWITNKPLAERQAILTNLITPLESVQLVENFKDGEALFQAIKAEGLEGIVCKNLNSTYKINGKDGRWLKIKNYRDLLAVIGGFTLRGDVVNALLLGLFDREGKLWYVGRAGTGKMSQQDWRKLTERLRPLVITERPFANKPEQSTGAYWVRPEITVKVQYIEWIPPRSLRQPSIQGFISVPPQECILTPDVLN